jgi:quinol monooxygenase YgiN
MSDPIVFVSHFRIREGKLETYRRLQAQIAGAIEAEKPGTMVYVAHLDPLGPDVTITHVFPDAEAMDRHFEGSDERSRAASEVMAPAGWEIYGSPSGAALEAIRQAAAASGVPLKLGPDYVAGYVRASAMAPAAQSRARPAPRR